MFFPGEYRKFKALLEEKNDLHIPKHKRSIMIVRLKKVIDSSFNLHKITKKILESLRGKTELRIGLIILEKK